MTWALVTPAAIEMEPPFWKSSRLPAVVPMTNGPAPAPKLMPPRNRFASTTIGLHDPPIPADSDVLKVATSVLDDALTYPPAAVPGGVTVPEVPQFEVPIQVASVGIAR